MALFSNPGMVAVQLADSQSCATARTFTVWTDEAAMMDFVTSDAHMASVGAFAGINRGGSTVVSWGDALVADITWDEALSRLSEVDTPY